MTTSSPSSLAFVVLVATYNGEAFLDAQLQSLFDQTVSRLDVIVSDDGSTDNTLALLRKWQKRWSKGDFAIIEGPRKGFSENFRSLLRQVTHTYDFVACSDQDDIWHEEKLAVATDTLAEVPVDRPAVYFSRTQLTDIAGHPLGQSPLFLRSPGLKNALVQSIGGGNTMVLNRSAAALLAESCRRTSFVTHDWWGYLLISGAGGVVHYDPVPHIDYRQHSSNLVGNNVGLVPRLKRLGMLLEGQFADWIDKNLSALRACFDLLTPDAQQVIAQFEAIRSGPAILAPLRLNHLGIYRQTLAGNISLGVAALLRKI